MDSNLLYIASCTPDGGIYTCKISTTGLLEILDFMRADRPMYLAKEDNKILALLLAPEGFNGNSALCSYFILDNGSLKFLNDSISTHGVEACHLYVEDKVIYCVNYSSGSIVKMPKKIIFHSGNGPNMERQLSSHPHYIHSIPKSEFIAVADLGNDCIYIYDKNLNELSQTKTTSGYGPRHLAFSGDGSIIYCLNELKSILSIYEVKNSTLFHIKDYSTLYANTIDKDNYPSVIRISDDEKYIYAANRGDNSIAWYKIVGNKLDFCGTVPCMGDFPRDFMITKDYLICANERDNAVTIFKLVNGKPIYISKNTTIKKPFCII